MMLQKGKVFLVDFGIARLFNPQQKGTAIGTAGYAAPEQYKGAAEPRSDIFSLGAVMHYLVTGKDPEDASHGNLFSFEQARKTNPSVPEYLDTLIMSMVDIVTDHRPQSAEAIKKALDGKQQTSSQSVPHPQTPSPLVPKTPQPSSSIKTIARKQPASSQHSQAPSPAVPKAPPPSPSSSQSFENVNAKDGAEMVLIPAGEFLMGSPKGEGNDAERPQHTVYLDAYYIYKYEVTNEQFAHFVRETGSGNDWRHRSKAEKEKHPVVNVIWKDAMAYCRWAGGSLLTEAQWEKAARGTDGRKYPWGNSRDGSRCNWDKGSNVAGMADIVQGRGTTPVGSFPSGASPYGVYDMAGNVWEWCSDWYDENYYKSSPSRNPEGGKIGQSRVIRGGSWHAVLAADLRCATRSRNPPDYGSHTIGFRVCRSSNTP